jgi:hypothetical protein
MLARETTERVGSLLLALVTLCLLATAATGTEPSEFQRLLKNPKMFNGERVTLVGLAEIGGSEFFLYPDVQSAKRGENAIFVDAHILNENPYEKFNNHWLKITGIVDVGIRPPLGVGECSIVLERLELFQRPPLRDDSVRAVFQNRTGETIDIKIPTPNGYSYAMRIPPDSATKATRISNGEVTVSKKSGETIAKGTLSWATADKYFDRNSRTFYYRISNGAISRVLPREAKNWK